MLATSVFVDGANHPFGELTHGQVRARAEELRAVVGWGPTARVVPVALAWRELAAALVRAGASSVAELPAEVLEPLAPQLWIVPPNGGLLDPA
ncbi:MAG TPA: hypothetical protein VFN48_03895 [Solirubrobacteraceae bacterium]|nr:hypothetical protein [Solirubrobacteraceae bacterium]